MVSKTARAVCIEECGVWFSMNVQTRCWIRLNESQARPGIPPIPQPRAAGDEDDEQDQRAEREARQAASGSWIAHVDIVRESRRRALTS